MKKTILYIDDIESNLFILKSVIESSASSLYDVITVDSAEKGLRVLLSQKIDIILLDVMMPEIDGFTTAKMIKSNKKTSNIPIIFITAKTDDESIEKCYATGGSDYASKPFNSVELLQRISFHLKLQEQQKQLKREKEYAQSIIDLQENLIFVSSGKNIITVNRAILEFFGMDSFSDFKSAISCIGSRFVNEENFFSLESVKDRDNWIDELIVLSQKKDLSIKMMKEDMAYIFDIKAVVFEEQYIVTLTDITQSSQLSQEYQHKANFDALTQIYNRNMFNQLIKRKIAHAKRDGNSFVFIMIDIDFFKRVNDTYGHLVGDKVLQTLAKLVKSHTREDDIFARWGGEEFMLCFSVNLKHGMKIAEEIRHYIEEATFDTVEHITCSFGVTAFEENDTIDTLIARSDAALYKAKEGGRNRVCQF